MLLVNFLGVSPWPYVPPAERPPTHEDRMQEVLIRKRLMSGVKDFISTTQGLDFVLPPCPNPPYPASDPEGKEETPYPKSGGVCTLADQRARGPGDSELMRWAGLIVRWNSQDPGQVCLEVPPYRLPEDRSHLAEGAEATATGARPKRTNPTRAAATRGKRARIESEGGADGAESGDAGEGPSGV